MQANYGKAARLLFQLPRGSRVFVALEPSNQWGWTEILLNKIAFLLEVLVWQKSKDAQRKSPQHRPKQFVPEFMKQPEQKSALAKGLVADDVDNIKALLKRPRK